MGDFQQPAELPTQNVIMNKEKILLSYGRSDAILGATPVGHLANMAARNEPLDSSHLSTEYRVL
ncbi:MAG: hypothetical protein R6X11_05990, partial [Desulfonatronovibrio sp.]